VHGLEWLQFLHDAEALLGCALALHDAIVQPLISEWLRPWDASRLA